MTRSKATAIDAIVQFLENHISPRRLRHTLGSVKVARELAARFNVPEEKAVLAALLHDAGKGYSKHEMVNYVRRRKLRVPYAAQIIRHDPSLLHSFISADIAARRFGITDKDILAAIAHHTLGAPRMSRLAKVIYLADAIAPDRRYPAVKKLRAASRRDLDDAFTLAMAHKLLYVILYERWIAPAAVRTWNACIGHSQESL